MSPNKESCLTHNCTPCAIMCCVFSKPPPTNTDIYMTQNHSFWSLCASNNKAVAGKYCVYSLR